MDRKEFFKTSLFGAAALATAGTGLVSSCAPAGKKGDVKLNLSFQERIAPGETLAEKFDFILPSAPVSRDSSSLKIRP